MRTIYIDDNFICHTIPGENLTAVETDFFDDRCDAYINGYRFIPEGKEWVSPEGMLYKGMMASPVIEHSTLEAAQRVYDEVVEILEAMMGVEHNEP